MSARQQDPAATGGAPTRILVVDDDPIARDWTAALLAEAFPSSAVHTLQSARRAARACAKARFDCVILDFNMPGMNGLECAVGLREAHPHMPIVLCTGAGDELLATKAIRSGVTDYLPKAALSLASLKRTIGNAINSASQARLIEEQRAELEIFAHALAHDFKQPLRQLLTFSEIVAENALSADEENLHRNVAFMRRAALRLAALVDVMSQYTLLAEAPAIEEIDLQEVFGSVVEALGDHIAERNGRVDCAELPRVAANATLMWQIFQNLIVNGLKYNRDAEPHVHVHAKRDGTMLEITFRDNGIGIAADHLDDIFKPLVRLHAGDFSGSGIGLAIVSKAVTLQGGEVRCESRVGEGSAFHVRLPLSRGGDRPARGRRAARTASSRSAASRGTDSAP